MVFGGEHKEEDGWTANHLFQRDLELNQQGNDSSASYIRTKYSAEEFQQKLSSVQQQLRKDLQHVPIRLDTLANEIPKVYPLPPPNLTPQQLHDDLRKWTKHTDAAYGITTRALLGPVKYQRSGNVTSVVDVNAERKQLETLSEAFQTNVQVQKSAFEMFGGIPLRRLRLWKSQLYLHLDRVDKHSYCTPSSFASPKDYVKWIGRTVDILDERLKEASESIDDETDSLNPSIDDNIISLSPYTAITGLLSCCTRSAQKDIEMDAKRRSTIFFSQILQTNQYTNYHEQYKTLLWALAQKDFLTANGLWSDGEAHSNANQPMLHTEYIQPDQKIPFQGLSEISLDILHQFCMYYMIDSSYDLLCRLELLAYNPTSDLDYLKVLFSTLSETLGLFRLSAGPALKKEKQQMTRLVHIIQFQMKLLLRHHRIVLLSKHIHLHLILSTMRVCWIYLHVPVSPDSRSISVSLIPEDHLSAFADFMSDQIRQSSAWDIDYVHNLLLRYPDVDTDTETDVSVSAKAKQTPLSTDPHQQPASTVHYAVLFVALAKYIESHISYNVDIPVDMFSALEGLNQGFYIDESAKMYVRKYLDQSKSIVHLLSEALSINDSRFDGSLFQLYDEIESLLSSLRRHYPSLTDTFHKVDVRTWFRTPMNVWMRLAEQEAVRDVQNFRQGQFTVSVHDIVQSLLKDFHRLPFLGLHVSALSSAFGNILSKEIEALTNFLNKQKKKKKWGCDAEKGKTVSLFTREYVDLFSAIYKANQNIEQIIHANRNNWVLGGHAIVEMVEQLLNTTVSGISSSYASIPMLLAVLKDKAMSGNHDGSKDDALQTVIYKSKHLDMASLGALFVSFERHDMDKSLVFDLCARVYGTICTSLRHILLNIPAPGEKHALDKAFPLLDSHNLLLVARTFRFICRDSDEDPNTAVDQHYLQLKALVEFAQQKTSEHLVDLFEAVSAKLPAQSTEEYKYGLTPVLQQDDHNFELNRRELYHLIEIHGKFMSNVSCINECIQKYAEEMETIEKNIRKSKK